MKVRAGARQPRCDPGPPGARAHHPKDGELCLGRAKPEETLVEAHSGPDVQIGRPTWA